MEGKRPSRGLKADLRRKQTAEAQAEPAGLGGQYQEDHTFIVGLTEVEQSGEE